MAERRRTKASEIVDDLMGRPPTADEVAKNETNLPELRLRPDTPTAEIDSETLARGLIDRLRSDDVTALALRETGTEPTVVMLPLERYLELAGKELISRREGLVATLDGRLVPPESDFAALHVEVVDPRDAWPSAGNPT